MSDPSALPLAGSFVERHGLWDALQLEAAREFMAGLEAMGVQTLRFMFADQHGISRGKSIAAAAIAPTLVSGCRITTTLILKDTAHRTVLPVWRAGAGIDSPRLAGAADLVMVPDPLTLRCLPWAPGNAWVLCDLYYPDGEPVEFSTRRILAGTLERLAARGLRYVSGLEMEFHIYRRLDQPLDPRDCTQPGAPPAVAPLGQGYQYLTETRYDELEPVLASLRQTLTALQLPLRSEEIEFGPSQVELTFSPCEGMATADNALLLRTAVKQVCHRLGYHATFMCRPHIANAFSSGWHLHQSLVSADSGRNCFIPEAADAALSPTGLAYLAGLLHHARESCLLTTPTINGYKRYRPHSLAPDRIQWGRDNKGAMLRVLGGAGDPATRIENRVGDPAANPYLYLASQILSGLAGLDTQMTPPPAVEEPYDSGAEPLPASLFDALPAFRQSRFYRECLGDSVVDWLAAIKQAELNRYLAETSDWEQREYFQIF